MRWQELENDKAKAAGSTHVIVIVIFSRISTIRTACGSHQAHIPHLRLRPRLACSASIFVRGGAKHTNESGLVIAQVKGGGYTASALRDFLHVMEREKATAGIFVTMNKTATGAALAEAKKLGNYKIGASSYPRLQFWSIEEYFAGHKPNIPPMSDPDTGKAMQDLIPMR